ncbi:calcium-binding protein [Oceanicella sp. SM1341]|uniref:M10 family metallopeptidase C-terminal domain-containing protein n=1 Tax=Oceanicella sp. SM1341 TaxID=1548889 RepID=UPI000E506910|nr:calcium-binding protein [Oceanicella sp. SM1341]
MPLSPRPVVSFGDAGYIFLDGPALKIFAHYGGWSDYDPTTEIHGSPNADTFYGGAEADVWNGKGENDYMAGRAGDDILAGGDGRDEIHGNADDDLIKGFSGDDFLYGGKHDDRVFGGDGADILDGGDGDDRLFGGRGDDHLTLGAGRDVAKGGAGADIFAFVESPGHDVIRDFTPGEDRMEFVSIDTEAEVLALLDTAEERDGATVLRVGEGMTLRLGGVTPDALSLDDFIWS